MHPLVHQIQEAEEEANYANKLLYTTQSEKVEAVIDLTLFQLDIQLDENSNLDLFETERIIRNNSLSNLNTLITEVRLLYDSVLDSLDYINP
jgi:hypothetical protein